MAKAIKTVKSKEHLTTLLHELNGVGHRLMQQWIDLDPIYVGQPDGANYEQSIQKHLVASSHETAFDGLWCEFGVKEGRSLQWLIDEHPEQPIHAFDSWQGLPEDWDHGTGVVASMACDPPKVPAHVHLHKGWFKDTVPEWRKTHTGPISFLHMDADIYSSTREVLFELNTQIRPGTIIVFDEFANFRLTSKMSNWQQHEYKALVEWIEECARVVQPLNRNWAYQATCVVVS